MGAISTAILIRYDLAHRDVSSSDPGAPRRERYLQLGGVRDPVKVDAIGRSLLALTANGHTTQMFQGIVIADGQMPERDYRVGDHMEGALVTGYTLEGDPDGNCVVRPELVDPLQLGLDRLNRQIKRMTAGGRNETSNPATSGTDIGSGTDMTPPEFSHDGPVAVTLSPPWRVRRPYWCSWVQAVLGTAGSTTTNVAVYRNGSSAGSVSMGAGETDKAGRVNIGFVPGDHLVIVVPTAGTGAADLTVTIVGAMV